MAYEGSASREICSPRGEGYRWIPGVSQARWTYERVAALRRLWAEGLSSSQCAKVLGGVTRNAVIGKLHRLGIAGRATPYREIKRKPRQARASTPRPPKLKEQPRAEPPPILPPIGPTCITQAEPNTCRFITGDPRISYQLCGHGAEEGSPYCSAHRAVCYTRERPARPDVAAKIQQRRGRLLAFQGGSL